MSGTPTARAALTLADWLAEAPFALAMSSGFFGFFAHCGMLAALEQRGLRPRRVCGSSAGGLVAGFWAAGLDAPDIRAELERVRRDDFWDPGPGLGLLRGLRFRRHLEALLPVATFADCRVPLSVSVYDPLARCTRVLEQGALAPALHATCAVPLLFQPVWIDGRPLLDGGVADRPGLAGMPDGERVLFHHLVNRSPWRTGPARVPTRPSTSALVITGLPKASPFHLDRGRQAIGLAQQATLRALDRPLYSRVITVAAPVAS